MTESHCVYIIQSNSSKRYYTGVSNDLMRRLEQHNQGENISTKNRGPWFLVWQSILMSKSEALQLERKIKKRGASRFLSDLSL